MDMQSLLSTRDESPRIHSPKKFINVKLFRKLNSYKACGFALVILTAVGLWYTANVFNPTVLPVTLRFNPVCTRPKSYRDAAGLEGISTSSSARASAQVPRIKYPDPINADYSHFFYHSWMPRLNDISTHMESMSLLAEAQLLLERHNITYLMIHGTLLGSYLFHDLIPWDDDLDLFIAFKDINKVRALFRRPEIQAEYGTNAYDDKFNTFAPPYVHYDADVTDESFCGNHSDLLQEKCVHTFHFYRRNSSHTTLRRNIGYPYVDFQFYQENATHMWSIDLRQNDPPIYERADFYPLQRRPFFNLWLPAPQRTHKVLKMKFSSFHCASKWYRHYTQTVALPYKTDCEYIMSCYPYVKRLPLCLNGRSKSRTEGEENDGVLEQLVRDDQVIHEVVIDEEYTPLNPFDL